MGWELTRVLEALLLPPGGPLLLALAGLFRGHGRGQTPILLAVATLYLTSTPFIASSLMQGLQSHPALTLEQARASGAGAIVVLGGGRYRGAPEYGGDTVGGQLLERLRYAAWLSGHTGLPVIPSGGSADGEGPAEAALARQTLEDELGAPVVAVEDASRTTRENALYTKAVVERLGVPRVLLVTHSWHMPRALEAFREAGVDTIPAPTGFAAADDQEAAYRQWLPSAQAASLVGFALHEYLGRLWYQLGQGAAAATSKRSIR